MNDTTKKFVEDQIEKLAGMVAKGFAQTATKEDMQGLGEDVEELKKDIERLEGKVDAGFAKLQEENDGFRDRLRVVETRIERIEA